MYRFSAADFAVYFNREKLPSRAQWQAVLSAKKLPLVFAEQFDPHKHPVCEREQVNHPDGEVVAKIGEATCRYQLDIYDEVHSENFGIESQRAALQRCDMSFCYRDEPANAANSLGVYLSAATLALAADGVIIWGQSKEDTRIGPEAFKVLMAKGWRRVKGPGHRFSKQDPFGPSLPPVVKMGERRGAQCPRCGLPLRLEPNEAYDGEKHTICGQLIIAPAPVD